jgi:hypothetical protein
MKLSVALRRVWRVVSPNVSLREWALFGIPLIVALAILISIGPAVQSHLFTIADTKAPSIYDAAHKSGAIAQFPDFLEWLTFAGEPLFIAQSILIALISLRKRSITSLVVSIGISSFAVMTAFDFILSASRWVTDPRDYLTNLVADFLGGMFLALCAGVVCYLRQHVSRIAISSVKWLLPLGTVALAVAISGVTFLILTWVYQPTLVRFDATFGPPANGFLAPKAKFSERFQESTGTESPPSTFTLVPDKLDADRIEAMSMRGLIKASLRTKERQSYDLELTLLGNCLRGAEDASRLAVAPTVKLNDIRSAFFSMEGEMSDLTILHPTSISIEQNEPASYWLRRGTPSKTDPLEIETFTIDKDVLRIRAQYPQRFLLSTYTVGLSNGKSVTLDRSIVLDLGKGRKRLILEHGNIKEHSAVQECRRIAEEEFRASVTSDAETIRVKLPDNVLGVSILVRVLLHGREQSGLLLDPANLVFSGLGGFVSVINPHLVSPSYSLGKTDLISFISDQSHVEVDGSPLNVPKGEEITAHGAISGEMFSEGQVRLWGDAEAMWLGSTRLNPTRWERMPTELQVLMLTFLGALLIATARAYRPVWRLIIKNDHLVSLK